MTNNQKRIGAFALAFMLSVPSFPFATANGEETQALISPTIEYNFSYDTPGSATGTITMSHLHSEDTLYLYWGDGKDNILKKGNIEYSAITSVAPKTTTAKYTFNSNYAAIPQGAAQILLKDSTGKIITTTFIPGNKTQNYGTLKYEYALMSDVHYNRYPKESSALPENEDYSVTAFNNALSFISNASVNTVFLTGDLSNQGELDAYNKFNKAISKYPDMTVYTCMGNHDVSWTKSSTEMVKQFTKNINTKKNKDKNVTDIAQNNLDFVYKKDNDYFVFLSQTKAVYSKNATLLADEQLNWLEKILNKYADKQVFILFHTYFANNDGNIENAVGNLINPGGYTYDLTYSFGAKDEVRFRKLLNKYNNVTLYSGHSHWAQDQVKYNYRLMIDNINSSTPGATLFHIPSVSAPRTIEENATKRDENAGDRSEGIIASRYDGCIVYTGVDFKNGKYLGYSVYSCNDGKTSTPIPEIKVGKAKIKKIAKAKKVSAKSNKYKTTIKFGKVKNAKKYELQYSTNSKFKASKTKKITTSKTSVTLKKLKAKTKYYVRVRGLSSQFGDTDTGKWSSKKTIKTK